MKLIANGLNGEFFESCLPPSVKKLMVLLPPLLMEMIKPRSSALHKNHHRLDIWMRYDHTVPVSPAFLSKLLANVKNNIFVNLYQIACTAKLFGGRDMALILVQPI